MSGRRSLISLHDLSTADIESIASRGAAFAAGRVPDAPLAGRIVGTYFRKTSTRTRTAFSAAALRLGATVLPYGADDLQISTGETYADTGRVLAGMIDASVVRTAGDPAELRALASAPGLAVINAMTADEHPTQALADLGTLKHTFGRLEGLRVLYYGEGNNTAAALVLALTRFRDTELHLRTPPGYGLPAEVAMSARRRAAAGAVLAEDHAPEPLPDVDVVYTTRWQTTGTAKADPHWRAVFEPFRVTEAVLEKCPNAVFMHDLPAHRGEEVTSAVLDGRRSIAFAQATAKMYGAMAVLEWCLLAGARP